MMKPEVTQLRLFVFSDAVGSFFRVPPQQEIFPLSNFRFPLIPPLPYRVISVNIEALP